MMNNMAKRTKKGLRKIDIASKWKVVLGTREKNRPTEPYCPKCGASKSATFPHPTLSGYRSCSACKRAFNHADLREARKRRKNQ